MQIPYSFGERPKTIHEERPHSRDSGKIFFPRKGAEELINQLLGFGIERYDDLVDAFSILILKLIDKGGTSDVPLIVKSVGMYDRYESKKRVKETHKYWDNFLDAETRREFDL